MEPQVFMLIDGGLCVVSVFCDKTFRTEITTKQYPIKAHPPLWKRLGMVLSLRMKKAFPCAKESISWK